MADTWRQSVICRYFVNGMCRQGSNCQYQHIQGSAKTTTSTDTEATQVPAASAVCRYYSQGSCKFGTRCRFQHVARDETAGTSSTQPQHLESSSASGNATVRKDIRSWPQDWVKAPEFVPTTSLIPMASSSGEPIASISGAAASALSYAQALNPTGLSSSPASEPLCPGAEASGICENPNCTYLHGEVCELCGRAALHPHNEEHRKKHTTACVKQHEVDMEISFAIQRSREKSCGVCFETIMEKATREQRFGILPNCNHCFCLTCIRKWRQAKQFDNKIIRACPECRVASDFVCPSLYWVDTKEEKEKLITDYKNALSAKDCKYFNKGRGKCPFGNKCFYLHALPDGTKTDVGPPVRHHRFGDADINFLQQMILWDFLDERDNRWMYSIDDIEELVSFFSDSEDSDWSEYELVFD